MNQLMISEPTQQEILIDYDILISAFISEACSIIYSITYSITILHRTPALFIATYYILCLCHKFHQFIYTCRIHPYALVLPN